MVRFGIAILWLLRFLPLALLNPLGQVVGITFYALGRERRRVVQTNLALCFPQMASKEREAMVRRHFRVLGRAFLEHGIFWWSSAQRIQRLVRIEGAAHLEALKGQPVMLLAPHFVGLDMGGVRISIEHQVASMYAKQKNPVVDALLLHGRKRFNAPRLFSRSDNVRSVVKALREGLPFYYLPDMDLGRRDSIFVPFFGVPTATITAPSRLALMGRATVLPVVTRMLPGSAGYVLQIYPPLENFPSEDVVHDTQIMNAFIEARVRELPEQYFWVHKRFKTRPEGEPSFYK